MYVSAAVTKSSKKSQRQPHQLPSGRHGMPREEVVRHQQERIFDAVVEVTSREGYAKMSVEDIISAAGVSRRTFYDYYKGKAEVFVATYDRLGRRMLADVLAAYERADDMPGRVRECVAALLRFLADNPAYADMCIVEVMAAGPDVLERRNRGLQVLAELMHQGAAASLPKRDRPPQLVAETIVGGVYEVIYSRVLQGRTAELPELLPELAYAILLPYVGPEVATAEMRKLRRRRPKTAS